MRHKKSSKGRGAKNSKRGTDHEKNGAKKNNVKRASNQETVIQHQETQ